jgi:hypothetical protein
MLDVVKRIMGGLLPMLNVQLCLIQRAYMLCWNVTGDSERSSHCPGPDRAGSLMMSCEVTEMAMAMLRTAVGAATAALASDLFFEMM